MRDNVKIGDIVAVTVQGEVRNLLEGTAMVNGLRSPVAVDRLTVVSKKGDPAKDPIGTIRKTHDAGVVAIKTGDRDYPWTIMGGWIADRCGNSSAVLAEFIDYVPGFEPAPVELRVRTL
jgi:hypothetical protein